MQSRYSPKWVEVPVIFARLQKPKAREYYGLCFVEPLQTDVRPGHPHVREHGHLSLFLIHSNVAVDFKSPFPRCDPLFKLLNLGIVPTHLIIGDSHDKPVSICNVIAGEPILEIPLPVEQFQVLPVQKRCVVAYDEVQIGTDTGGFCRVKIAYGFGRFRILYSVFIQSALAQEPMSAMSNLYS